MKLIAFYLPQFHPNPANDKWWGTGFTEWRNVVQAHPLFRGHYQPHLAGELGYYDLRVPEVQEAQAEIARAYGVFGFCYYHYWFNGKRLLGRPLDLMLSSGKPDFPFCLCWANESWTRAWDGRSGKLLIEQKYSEEDDRRHLDWLGNAFADPRYIRIGTKPLFLIYRALRLPDPRAMIERWRNMARRMGIGEIFFARVESFPDEHSDPRDLGFDAAVEFQPDWDCLPAPLRRGRVWQFATRLRLTTPVYQMERIYDYGEAFRRIKDKPAKSYPYFRCVMPGWDNTSRRKEGIVVFSGSTPKIYEDWLKWTTAQAGNSSSGERIVFVNAWNEWGEGNHLEPDAKYGRAYLEATCRALNS